MKISSLLRELLCIVGSLVALCACLSGEAIAQAYPGKTIRIIVPTAAGGGTDFIARVVGQKLAAAVGQPVVIDNRAGSGGNIGHELLAKAPPDGYTLIVVAPSLSSNPSLYRKLSYDPIKDFAPISQLAAMAYILAVHPSVPATTVKEFVALAKSKKGGLIYATPGSGQLSHLGMELLKSLGEFDAVHVPYKGDAPAMADLIAGQVDAFISSMVVGRPQARSGKIRALAVTSLSRSVFLPEVPTVAESGFPGYEVNGWFGFLAPAGTPREIVTRLHDEVSRILKLAEVRELMAANGLAPVGNTPEEFAVYLNSQIIKWAKVIKQSGARAD